MNQKYTIKAESVSKRFGRQRLFKDINFQVETGSSLAVTGPNGSGKSTLVQILAGLQSPTKGAVEFVHNDRVLEKYHLNSHCGFISPLINPYDELTGIENIHFSVKGVPDEEKIKSLLESFKLSEQRNKSVRFYSSGMKQRLKFIISVINDPPVLFLDEPGTNLDREGKDVIYSYIKSVKKEKLIVIATNEKEEVTLCSGEVRIA
jgi:ABC-type multidrug transport system ATPase subunit